MCEKRRVQKMNMCVTCSKDECMRNVLKETSLCVKRRVERKMSVRVERA